MEFPNRKLDYTSEESNEAKMFCENIISLCNDYYGLESLTLPTSPKRVRSRGSSTDSNRRKLTPARFFEDQSLELKSLLQKVTKRISKMDDKVSELTKTIKELKGKSK